MLKWLASTAIHLLPTITIENELRSFQKGLSWLATPGLETQRQPPTHLINTKLIHQVQSTKINSILIVDVLGCSARRWFTFNGYKIKLVCFCNLFDCDFCWWTKICHHAFHFYCPKYYNFSTVFLLPLLPNRGLAIIIFYFRST